jgi:hypothetical protein
MPPAVPLRPDAGYEGHSTLLVMCGLKLDALYVVYPGRHRYRLSDRVEVVPLWALLPTHTFSAETKFVSD